MKTKEFMKPALPITLTLYIYKDNIYIADEVMHMYVNGIFILDEQSVPSEQHMYVSRLWKHA